MHHRADDKDSSWLDKLVSDELAGTNKEASSHDEFVAPMLGDHNPFGSSILDKLAADEAPAAAPAAPAATPAAEAQNGDADLDAIEKQIDSATSIEELNALEEKLKAMNEGGSLGGDDASAGAPADDAMNAEMGATDPVTGAAPGADVGGLQKSIDGINKKLDDKSTATQETLLKEIKKLNDEMGNNKPIDLNSTIDQSS